MAVLLEIIATTDSLAQNDILNIIKDSIAEVSKHTTPYYIGGYEPDLISIIVAFIALFVSFLSLLYTYKQYKSQETTQENTSEANKHSFNMLSAVGGHFRCLVYTLAVDYMYDMDCKRSKTHKIASRVYLDKLKSPNDIVPVSAFITQDEAQEPLNSLKTQLYMYALEVENAACNVQNLIQGTLSEADFNTLWKTDYSNLCYKPIYIIKLIMDTSAKLASDEVIENNHTTPKAVAVTLLKKFNGMMNRQFIHNANTDNDITLIKDKLEELKDLDMKEIQRSIDELVNEENLAASQDEEYNVSFPELDKKEKKREGKNERRSEVFDALQSILPPEDASIIQQLREESGCNIWVALPLLLRIEVAVELQFKMKSFIERTNTKR